MVAYTVAERSREIGLRMALGAPAKRVRTLVVRQTLVPVAIGALVGVVLAAVAGRGLSSMLYEVTSTDPVTLAAVVVLFIGAAGLASYVPARRASRVDPAHTLRD